MRTKQQKTAQTTVSRPTVYPKKYAHGFCFAVLCCGSTLTDFPISIRLTSLALWQSNDCPSASKATLMNMDKCFMWIHYERLHNHNKAKHNKTVCIFLRIYCTSKQYIYFPFDDDNKTKYICARHHRKRNGIHVGETHSPHILYINDWDDNDDILSFWLLGAKFSVISIEIKLKISIQWNKAENAVCKRATLLSRPQSVKEVENQSAYQLAAVSMTMNYDIAYTQHETIFVGSANLRLYIDTAVGWCQ